MVYCFDLDDTICIHRNRDYPNAIPVERTINNMRSLRSADHGAKIIIYTSRGMNSCNGDAALAERKNRDTIEKWLSKNRVPYDEIIFGKPLADVYIDDKGMSAESFKNGGIEVLNGFSGASVIRLSDVVIKEGDRVAFEYGWYKSNAEQNFKTHMVPAVYSVTLGKKLCLQYIEGRSLSSMLSVDNIEKAESQICKVAGIIKEFSSRKTGCENNVQDYCVFIEERARNAGVDVKSLNRSLMDCDDLREATFCHGDFTALNVIVSCFGAIYLIDPSVSPISSWLLDAAKFRASLNGLDAALNGKGPVSRKYIPVFDSLFADNIDTIKILEKTQYLRVMHYAKKLGKIDVFERLKEMFYS